MDARLLLLWAFMAFPAWGAPPGWQETRDADLAGPAVTWVGIIEGVVRDGAYTCFLLKGAQPFATCAPGSFDATLFGPGQALRVKGSLGQATPRKLGETEFSGHFIAAPFVERTEIPRWEPVPVWRDPYYPYGYAPGWGMCVGRGWPYSGVIYCPAW